MANYQELRERTLGSTREEEAVTVNTRALIDKVLARYSSENTTLRELIQNAADACATSVEVRYETDVGEHVQGSADVLQVVKGKVRRLVVKNDGMPFREEDWERLKRIAEGNPSEEKVGAFGVGFYSVFADTEDPFIASGKQTMAFYWKGNSLFTRRGTMAEDPYTTFLLDFREPGDLPDLKNLCQFFATSLTFVNLQKISLYINDIQMLVLEKKVLPSSTLAIPKSIIPKSKEGLMKIIEVKTSNVQLEAKYMNVTHYKPKGSAAESAVSGLARMLFGRVGAPATQNHVTTANLEEFTTAAIFLRIATATVATSVSSKFAQELERATKKPPPRRTTISCLTMSKDEQDASESDSEIFANVIPSKSGRIFIGFPTHQTTGINAHIAAHSVIPTVERENIDLNARIVKTWNAEMLRAAGILARILYSDEMDMLRKRADGLKTADLEKLYDQAIHIMQQFTSHDSTPSMIVGDYIAEAFWNCTNYASIELMSTRGVLPSSKIRLANEVTFLEGLPLLPDEIIFGAKKFVQMVKQAGFISEITFTDIQNSLSEKPLGSEEAHAFLKWLAREIRTGKMEAIQAPLLLSGAIAMVSTTDANGEVVVNGLPVLLGTIKYHVNIAKLAADIPLPPECVPFSLTKRLIMDDLNALGWKELAITEWVDYVAKRPSRFPEEQNIELSPTFANQVLGIISKNWDRIPSNEKEFVVNILKNRMCIPTKQGMKLPREAYFPNVRLFPDLPITQVRNIKDKFLVALGLRKTVELKLVFERLVDHTGTAGANEKWSHVELIKYLTSVQEDIPSEDIRKLCNMEICKAEPAGSTRLHKISELYEPLEPLRNLSLPILYWPSEWREQSNEAKFLAKLGLRRFPPEDALLKLATGQDKQIREKALRYFTDNFYINNYSASHVSASHLSFLPLQNDKDRLVTPFQCYSNSSSQIMGYDVIRNDLAPHAPKFGVKADPDIRECVKRLKKAPPAGPREAKEKFGYFADRMSDLAADLATDLGNSSIVPVKSASGVKHITPRICYIGDSNHKYGQIFDFVDFGISPNAFLMRCGSKSDPTTAEIAYRLAKEPDHLYQVFRSESKYLSMLRTIADDWPALKRDKELVKLLKANPCLAAYREIPVNSKTPLRQMADDEEGMREFLLARAEDIFLIDDISNYNLFRADVLAAPEEDVLEKFYLSLGSTPLSASIEKQAMTGATLSRTPKIVELHKLILERARLFIHSNNETVAHDAHWLENNLGLQPVHTIRYKMILRTKGVQRSAHLQEKTAAVVKPATRGENSYVLFVTPKWEFYDIADGLVRLILKKPKPHSALLLESLLSTDLMILKQRGYNVGRILAKKQAEARLMEQERLKKVEDQRKALEQQEKRYQDQLKQQQQLQQQQQQQQLPVEDKISMPGAFTDSPPRIPQTHAPVNGGSFLHRGFSRFSKLMQEAPQNAPPTPEPPRQLTQRDQGSAGAVGGGSSHDKEPRIVSQKPTEPHRITANLQRAVQAGRDYASNTLFSPPKTFDVKEESTFCDSHGGQDIVYAVQTPTHMRVYLHKSLSEAARQEFLRVNAVAINTFSLLLLSVGEVFSMAPSSLHIHYDPHGRTIAFNLGGAIFCNISFFLQLHAEKAAERKWSADAFKYWWVTICHELAHNLVKEHGSNHSFYTESFVQEYFEKAMRKVAELEKQVVAPPAYQG